MGEALIDSDAYLRETHMFCVTTTMVKVPFEHGSANLCHTCYAEYARTYNSGVHEHLDIHETVTEEEVVIVTCWCCQQKLTIVRLTRVCLLCNNVEG